MGHSAIVNTSGNGDCHIILRGGKEPNYSAKHVAEVKEGLNKAGLPAQVMIDFSHANSSKQFKSRWMCVLTFASRLPVAKQPLLA